MKRGWWATGLVCVLVACESTAVPKTDIPDSPNPTIDAGADSTTPTTVAPKLSPIGKQTLVIGKTVSFRVTVERGSLTGALDLAFASLPAGVTAKSDPLAADASSTEVTLSATETAPFGTVKPSVQVGKDASLSVSFDLEIRGVPGTLDKSFGVEGLVSEPTAATRFVTVARDGAIVEQQYGGRLLKRTPNGAIDTSFGNQGIVEMRELAGVGTGGSTSHCEPTVDDTGAIFAMIGHSAAAGVGNRRLVVAKLTAGGSRVANFGTNGLAYAPDLPEGESYEPIGLVRLTDASHVIGAAAPQDGGGTKLVLFHIRADGTFDTTWGAGRTGRVDARTPGQLYATRMWAIPSGGFFVAGKDTSVWQEQFTKDGAPDSSFGAGQGWTKTAATFPSPSVSLFARRADGALDVGYSEANMARTTRFTASGILDPGFTQRSTSIPAWPRSFKGALVDSSGRTYFTFQGEGRELDVWRFLPTGEVDTALNGTGRFRVVLPDNVSSGLFSPSPTSVHELPDGRILVAAVSQSNFILRFWP